MGGASDNYREAEAERSRVSLPEVVAWPDPGLEVIDGLPYATEDPHKYELPGRPTDWDEFYEAYTVLNAPEPAPIEYADIPVIDPEFLPRRTESEASAGNPVEEEVAFWDTVGDIFTTTAPGAIAAYGQNQGWWGTPAAVAPQQLVLPQRPMEPFPQGIDMMGSGASGGATTVQDPGTCPPPGARYLRYNCQTGQLSKIPRRRRRRLLTSSDLKDLAALKAIVGGGAKMDGAIVAAVRR